MGTSWEFLDEICRFSQPGWPRKSENPNAAAMAAMGGWAAVAVGGDGKLMHHFREMMETCGWAIRPSTPLVNVYTLLLKIAIEIVDFSIK